MQKLDKKKKSQESIRSQTFMAVHCLDSTLALEVSGGMGALVCATYHVEAPALHFPAGERGAPIFTRLPLDVLVWFVQVD